MKSSIIFFLKIAIYFYLATSWLKFICDFVSQGDLAIRYEERVTKRVGGEVPCQQICQEKYSLITGNTNLQNWVSYMNPAQAKNTANMQIDQIADHLKKVSINYASQRQLGKDYRISFIDVGCYFKKQINQFQCFDTEIAPHKFRIIRSSLNVTLWQKVSYLIKDYALAFYPQEFRTQFLPVISTIIPSQTFVLGFVTFGAFIAFLYKRRASKQLKKKEIKKDEPEDVDNIQYGFKVKDYCKEAQQKKIADPYNRLNFNVNQRIRDSLERPQNSKLKLITQSTQGIGITSNIQAWCQQTSFFLGKEVIHYRLKSNILDPKLANRTHLENLQSIFYSIINKSSRNIQNIFLYQLQSFFSSCASTFRSLFQVSQWILIILALITVSSQGYTFLAFSFIFMAYILNQRIRAECNRFRFKFASCLKDIWKGVIRFFNGSGYIYSDIDQVQKIQNYEAKLLQILHEMQIVQEGKQYDVILVSSDRVFSEKWMKKIQEQKQSTLVKKKGDYSIIRVQFEHRLIYPLSFFQAEGILQDIVVSQSLQKTKILGFFTNNIKQLSRSLRHYKIDKRYVEDNKKTKNRFTTNKCIAEINSILHEADQKIINISKVEQIKKYLKDQTKLEEGKASDVQVEIKRIIGVIRNYVGQYQISMKKQDDQLWKSLEKVREESGLPILLGQGDENFSQNSQAKKNKKKPTKKNSTQEIVYKWYTSLEDRRIDRQYSQPLQQWLQDEKNTQIFKDQSFKNSPEKKLIFETAIKYLNAKKILVNGNFSSINYVFPSKSKIQEIAQDKDNEENSQSEKNWAQSNKSVLAAVGVILAITIVYLLKIGNKKIGPLRGEL